MENLGFQLAFLVACTSFSSPDYARSINFCSDSSGFLLVKKAKGIELYERWHEIATDRMAREVKVVYSINATIESAASLIESGEKATQWNKSSSMYRIIPKNENSWIGYIQYDLPWPMDNQDCVLEYSISRLNGNHIIIDFKSIENEFFPTSNNVVRIADIKGKWVFRGITTGTVVEYSITTMPSPTLPRWLTDPLIRNNLIDTMDEFRNILEASKK
jgi:hypothetical protein